MKTMSKSITKEKENGRFYTPDFIVNNILDLAGYCGPTILRKHVIDNSCGDGAFLRQIVKRYCEEAQKAKYDIDMLRHELSTYIHGIEIEMVERNKCLNNISVVAEEYGVCNVEWDVVCQDATLTNHFDGAMDFVLGNPPYVRVHNMSATSEEIKRFSFARSGMTDLFIVFYELGIRMLNGEGTLGYITPSSYFNSLAGAFMRNYLSQNRLLKAVVDLKHFQAFSSTTYTAITILQKGREEHSVDYYRYDEKERQPFHVETLLSSDYQIAGNYFFAKQSELELLKSVLFNEEKCDVAVKNGYATLCDSVFIQDFEFDSAYIIPAVKASKGIWKKIFFPYDRNAVLISEDELRKDRPLYQYLFSNKDTLTRRSNEKDADKYWYAFGRSQAIADTYKDKLTINSLLRSEEDFKFVKAPAGTGVYGGLYIVSETIPLEEITHALKTKEFFSYITLLGKYKSGGYYTFSSKDVKSYLDYKFAHSGGTMLKNQQFLEVIKTSFKTYLEVGSSRSTAKLKHLHGSIANDLKELFGPEYDILSQGIGNGKEGTIEGRYYPKKVDITVTRKGKPVAGYAVKFVMRNYSQNSNNYFENMFGETANIRANGIPYFQIFIVFEKVPYYKSGGAFQKYEEVVGHHLDKYVALSKDDPETNIHTPNKMLMIILRLKEEAHARFADSEDYAKYYKSIINDVDLLAYSTRITDAFADSVILNDYEDFIKKTHDIVERKIK